MADNFKKNLNYYVDYWKQGIDFSGKTDRHTYWMTVLMCFIITSLFTAVANSAGLVQLVSLYGTVATIPSLAITVRRMNDVGKAWPWIFIVLIPIFGWIWYIVLLCRKSV